MLKLRGDQSYFKKNPFGGVYLTVSVESKFKTKIGFS